MECLSRHHLEIWFDEFTLEVGDGLRRSIERGLANSRFGIVVLSSAFFSKGWPERELDGLVAREIDENRRLVLPIWHGVTRADLVRVWPTLADVYAVDSAMGVAKVCEALLKKLRPEESPFIAARDELIRRGIQPPVISDEWWLDIVEASNRLPASGVAIAPEQVWGRWSFHLPHQYESGAKRGWRLAWTAMQLEWTEAAEVGKICQTTHPERVHDFINKWPGLMDRCLDDPDYLLLYAPQLSIQEFSGPFGKIFDKILSESTRDRHSEKMRGSRSGTGLTIDGEVPLCDKEIALRHPTFGNYDAGGLASFYVHGEMFAPPTRCHEIFDYIVWFLSDDSKWLPSLHREILTQGMRDWAVWPGHLGGSAAADASLSAALYRARSHEGFMRSRKNIIAVDEAIDASLRNLGISGNVASIRSSFLERGFVKGHFELRDRRHPRRRKP